jgi:pimeloyl-ACP methyl ester carboxylesterase
VLPLLCLAAQLAAAAPADAQPQSAELLVYIGPNEIGRADSIVERSANGWTVSGTGRLLPPLDLTTRRLTIRYTTDWKPAELQIEAITQGMPLAIRSTFAGTEARNEIARGPQTSHKVDAIAADAVVLPNLFFQAYEALAMRLGALEQDTATFAVYVAPQAQIEATARRLEPQAIATGGVPIRARRFALTFMNPGAPLDAELWVADDGRLIRFAVPAQQLVVARSDIARVNARLQTIDRAGDHPVRIPGNGFTLAGTVSEPGGRPGPDGRFPVIVMVPGAGDRDETVAGIPLFGQLAGAFADAGYLVVRYDKRGVGQSGGRPEAAALEDYAADVRAVVRVIAERKDVDRDRIALFGHGEGSWIALLAAARDERVAAVVLAEAPSGTGADLVLEQQAHLLTRLALPDAEKQARMDLQRRIQAAVLGQGDWTDVPDPLRYQADTPWFRSFLAFDPGSIMRKVRQPLLLIQGELDRQVAPHHVDRLAELARARKRPEDGVDVVKLPRINHLLVEAKSGDVEEYARLEARQVSPEVTRAVVEWLGKTLAR